MDNYPMVRDLDGAYFRVERNGKWQVLCFTDLTFEEQKKVTEGRSTEWLQNLAITMALTVRGIGDKFDIVCE